MTCLYMVLLTKMWGAGHSFKFQLTDVRDLQKELKTKGVTFVQEADKKTNGPASFITNDPDGNPVLIGQRR